MPLKRFSMSMAVLLILCGRAAAFGPTEQVAQACSGIDPGVYDEPLTPVETELQCSCYVKGLLDATNVNGESFRRGLPPMVCVSEEVCSTRAAEVFLAWVSNNRRELKRPADATRYVALAKAFPRNG